MTEEKSERMRAIEDILLDMKDTSDLMLDLAYSSIFYGSRDLARQVVDLEAEVGGEYTQIHRLAMEAVREHELSIDHAQVLTRVARTAEDLANASMEIADVILRDVELHPVLKMAIRTSDSATTQVHLHPDSPYAGHKLGEIELESETGMRVLSVKRGRRWTTNVGSAFRLQAGDQLIAVGPAEAMEEFLMAADPSGASAAAAAEDAA